MTTVCLLLSGTLERLRPNIVSSSTGITSQDTSGNRQRLIHIFNNVHPSTHVIAFGFFYGSLCLLYSSFTALLLLALCSNFQICPCQLLSQYHCTLALPSSSSTVLIFLTRASLLVARSSSACPRTFRRLTQTSLCQENVVFKVISQSFIFFVVDTVFASFNLSSSVCIVGSYLSSSQPVLYRTLVHSFFFWLPWHLFLQELSQFGFCVTVL